MILTNQCIVIVFKNYFPRLFFAFLEVLSNFWKLMYSIHIKTCSVYGYYYYYYYFLFFVVEMTPAGNFPLKQETPNRTIKNPKVLCFSAAAPALSQRNRDSSRQLLV